MRKNIFLLPVLALAATTLLNSCSENDTPEVTNTTTDGELIGFATDITQDWYAEQDGTRASMQQCIPRIIPMESSEAGIDAYLEETSIPGINPKTVSTQEALKTDETDNTAATRGTPIVDVNGLGDFSTFCYYSDNGNTYYENIAAGNDGQLKTEKLWPMGKALKFYAVHPYDATTANFTSNASGISYSFTVDESVQSEKDLMYAATGSLSWNAQRLAPLHFKHALTAVKFAVGSNLSYGATITSVTLKNVYTTGTFTLPADDSSTGTWSNLGGRKDITLSNISITTDDNGGMELTGTSNIFLMIPQDLTKIEAVITMTVDGRTLVLTSSLAGSTWLQGHTRTYTITDNTGSVEYVFTASSPDAIEYTDTQVGEYSVTSYCYYGPNSNPIQKPVGWRIIKYEYSDDDGVTWTDNGTSKPEWLTTLSLESGSGGTEAETGTATVLVNYIDKKQERDNELKNATAKNDYDLSQGGETANCYLISSPGTYKIPLIYGNMRKSDGTTNLACLGSTAWLRRTFVNATGTQLSSLADGTIQDVTNSTEASLVWSDISEDIVSNLAVDVDNNYLTFTVTKEHIEQGNAVIGIKNDDGYLWSWHLWFAPEDALNTISCINYTGYEYKFTKETLGTKFTEWIGSVSESVRKIRITIQQTSGSNKTATIIIAQNPGKEFSLYAPAYEFGRKDALPGVQSVSGGSFSTSKRISSYPEAIMNPNIYYNWAGNWCSTDYNNPWSANNYSTTLNDNAVIKTVYDPCPVGFHMPASNAFTGFTLTGEDPGGVRSKFNVVDNTAAAFNADKGWKFYSYGKKDATEAERTGSAVIYFPATGYRQAWAGVLHGVGAYGYYWSAIPEASTWSRSYMMSFTSAQVAPVDKGYRGSGFMVRPVHE